MATVRLLPMGRLIHVPSGTLLREALQREGILLDYPCGGKGSCRQCRVVVEPAPEGGKGGLAEEESRGGARLACQLRVETDCTVLIPEARLSRMKWDQVLRDRDISLEGVTPDDPGAAYGSGGAGSARAVEGRTLGFAVDLGTTTVDLALIDLESGAVLGRGSFLNRQTAFGADVISRAQSFHRDPGPVRDAALAAVQEGAREILRDAGASPSEVVRTVIVGNPIMLHILLAVDPYPLTLFPFTPAFTRGVRAPIGDFSWDFQAEGFVETLPLISAYIGADTVAMAVSLGLEREEKTTLAIDIGTNGEIVLSTNGALVAASTAAGPAFEGAEISCGMRALEGAVYGVSILDEGTLVSLTIGGAAPKGICGTGLVSAIARLRERGIVEKSGRMVDRREVKIPALAGRLVTRAGEKAFSLTEDVYVSQGDVRKLQLAKGAIRAGIDMLLEQSGIRFADLDVIRLAGKFGAGLDTDAAMAIGLIPRLPLQRVQAVGNSALRGAALALVSREHRSSADRVAEITSFVELGEKPEFQDRFADAMSL
jgi:uncharacterized 2Fe-2S/4Fe-4S cluster protein (DUF4445 family)